MFASVQLVLKAIKEAVLACGALGEFEVVFNGNLDGEMREEWAELDEELENFGQEIEATQEGGVVDSRYRRRFKLEREIV